MATRVLKFNPVDNEDVQRFEKLLDVFLSDGWELVATAAGGSGIRPKMSMGPSSGPFPIAEYMVFVLRNGDMSQEQAYGRYEVVDEG